MTRDQTEGRALTSFARERNPLDHKVNNLVEHSSRSPVGCLYGSDNS